MTAPFHNEGEDAQFLFSFSFFYASLEPIFILTFTLWSFFHDSTRQALSPAYQLAGLEEER
jgi:hypothetical protein